MTWDPNIANQRSPLPLGGCPVGTPMLPKLPLAFGLMCIGDSFTTDVTDTPTDSWRYMLYLALIAVGLNPTFIGDVLSGTAPSNRMRAYAGAPLVSVMSGGTHDTVAFVAAMAPSARPDVYIIAFGTNDAAAGGTDTSQFGAHLVTFIGSQLEPLKPGARYLVVKTPIGQSTANLTSIWAQMVTAVATLQGMGILCALADCDQVQGTVGYIPATFDQNFGGLWIHPWNPGYYFMETPLFPLVVNATGRNAVWPGDPVEG